MTSTTETLRAAFARATIAAENASRSLYVAEKSGRGVGLARHRESAAQQKLAAAERAYRAAA